VDYIFPNIIIAKKIQMLPIEVVCRNIAAGHLVKKLPFFKTGQQLKPPIIEFFYKSDELHDPMLNEYHIQALNIASERETLQIKEYTLKANNVLKDFFKKRNLIFVDFKIEFGRLKKDELIIGDELNGDSMRLWSSPDGGIAFDKDGYRSGDSLDKVRETYIETFKVITGEEPLQEGLES
ncbi:MAG: phosphoribosylaminoimidazolesuccinocarboxamide synthase, partial [Candidatus Odinarchaeota archaeon]